MTGSSKRSINAIDLTGDSDTEPGRRQKVARHNAAVRSNEYQSNPSLLNSSETEDDENGYELVDLTQSVDDRGVGLVQVGAIGLSTSSTITCVLSMH